MRCANDKRWARRNETFRHCFTLLSGALKIVRQYHYATGSQILEWMLHVSVDKSMIKLKAFPVPEICCGSSDLKRSLARMACVRVGG